MGNEQGSTIEALFEEERSHSMSFSQEEEILLAEAFEKANLALQKLVNVSETQPLYTEKGIAFLLLAKSARDVRFAVIGVEYGFYDGAWAVLRSALESAQYAALFHSRKEDALTWIRSALRPAAARDRDDMRADLRRRAQDAFSDLCAEHADKQSLRHYWKESSEFLHSSLIGVAGLYGIEPEAFLPHGIEDMLDSNDGNFDFALAVASLRRQQGDEGRPVNLEIHVDPVDFFGKSAEMVKALARLAAIIARGVLQVTERHYSPHRS